MKKFLIKVYDNAGNYITTWDDAVASDIAFNNEINTGGGELVLTLARNAGDYGEGTDVDFDHNVKVYCIDKEQPNGIIVFQGSITGYTPIYKNNSVKVTILSYGSQLNNTMVEGTSAVDINQNTGSSSATAYYYNSTATRWRVTAQNFMPSLTQELKSITVKLARHPANFSPSTNVRIHVYESSFPSTYTPISSSVVAGYEYIPFGDEYLVATSTAIPISSTTASEYEFVFPIRPTLDSTRVYVFTVSPEYGDGSFNPILVYYTTTTSAYPVYELWDNSYTGGGSPAWSNATAGDMYFITEYVTGATYVPFASTDPSTILQTIIDASVVRGSEITYDASSIDDTGTTVSYTFNVNTTLEGVRKCLEIAPANWYWYIDYATNYIHFHEKNTVPDHTFTLERDLIDAQFEKRIEDVVNVIYFTGGDTGGGTNFFKKYTVDASIASYGFRANKYTDGRVTTEATADTIANSILEVRSEPELRVTLEVLDSNNEQGVGYDIESIHVGDVVAVRNITQQVGLSTWDVARWDDAYWDFNVFNLSSLNMQVQRIEYGANSALVYCSTIAPDVNKRIEDINRNLETLQTANNPTVPS